MRSRVDPVKGNDFLRAGSLCHMTLTVQTVRQSAGGPATALMYEVLADQVRQNERCENKWHLFLSPKRSRHSHSVVPQAEPNGWSYLFVFFHRLMVSLISCCKLVWVLLDLKKECGLVLITRKHLRAGGRDT